MLQLTSGEWVAQVKGLPCNSQIAVKKKKKRRKMFNLIINIGTFKQYNIHDSMKAGAKSSKCEL